MNTTQAQHKSLNDSLVSPADHLEFEKCNTRFKTDIKPKEETFQVVLDALALTPFYQAILIIADVLAIYMQESWATITVHKSSIRFMINKKKFSFDVEIFREIIQICPKILGQESEELLLEQEVLSFIRDLGHTGDITYLTDVNVDYLHQPRRAFATFINKEKRLEWTRFVCPVLKSSRDRSILRRNKIFWHTARYDTMFTSMRCISKHEDTQVYGTILPKHLTNQAMLESKAYQTYYAFSYEEKSLKPKSKKDFHISHASSSGDRTDLESGVLDEQQQKTSGTNEGSNTIPRALDVPIYASESNKESWGESDEEDDDEDNFEDDADINDDDSDDNDESDDKRTESNNDEIPDPNKSNEEHDEEEEYVDEFNIKEDEKIDEEEDDEVTKELYKDSRFEQEEEDAHVTLTHVLDTQKTEGPTQRSSVSSDSTSKLLNLDNPSHTNTMIASLMDTTVHHEITSATTVPPPPPFFIPLQQEATPTPTPTTSEATASFTYLLNFAYSSYEAAATSEFELTKILIDKIEKNKSFDVGVEMKEIKIESPAGSDRGTKRRKSSKDAESSRDSRSKENKSSSTSKHANQSQHKSFGKSAHAEEPSHTVEDSSMQQDQEFVTRDNNEKPADMEGGDLRRPYLTSVTKTNVVTHELKWIEDFVPELWSPVQLKYDQHAYLGTSHWGPKRQTFYGYASNFTSSKDVYYKIRIIAVTRLKIMKKYDYGHMEEIEVHRDDQKLYTFKKNQRNLPRDIPLDSVVVLRYEKRSKSKNKRKVPTEIELVLEQTQQDTSYEVSISAEGVEELKRKVKIKREKKEALLTLRQKPSQYICCQESQR
uniref:Uncharacterized protein n=1 Tax=Tanacetum cinerariifolium TaxID=118510 RepID=A0A6L2MJQ8_TANCI|nr:hypothetical protein [Tanacetum cinerariifolium]